GEKAMTRGLKRVDTRSDARNLEGAVVAALGVGLVEERLPVLEVEDPLQVANPAPEQRSLDGLRRHVRARDRLAGRVDDAARDLLAPRELDVPSRGRAGGDAHDRVRVGYVARVGREEAILSA